MGVTSIVVGLVLALVAIIGSAAVVIVMEMRRRHREQLLAGLLALFAPALSRVQTEPRELVAWARLATTARTLYPDLFDELDAASGGRFPFSRELIEGSHARWTSQWLAWERDHDLEYKRRASRVESKLDDAPADEFSHLQSELAAIEQEKLQRYQERYEEYVRVGKDIGELD